MSNQPKFLMKYRSSYNKESSWSLAPLSKQSPILAGFYDPSEGVLALIYDAKKDGFSSIPKLDANGRMIPKYESGNEFEEERVMIEKYFEHYLSHPDDIKWFLERFVDNNFNFKADVKASKSSIIMQP